MEMEAHEAIILLNASIQERNESSRELGRFLRSKRGKGVQPVLEVGNIHNK